MSAIEETEVIQETEAQNEETTPSETQEVEEQEEVLSVSFDGEETPPQEEEFSGQPAPDWVKDLRRKNRELERELKKIKQEKPNEEETKALPKKPTLADCDYDEDLLQERLDKWYDEKKTFDLKEYENNQKLKQQQEAWQNKLTSYQTQVKELKASDYSYAEDNVKDEMSETQQGILLNALKNPALFVYAVGKNEAKLKQLAQIQDPILFAAEVARLETQIKSNRQQRATPPPPEKKPSGSSAISGSVETQLKKLTEKAAITGDRSELIQFKKSKGLL